jgi:hypothetical protein
VLTLALNQNSHTRPTSMEGRRITLYQGEMNESKDDTSKPGTLGIFLKCSSKTSDLSSQELLSAPPTSSRGEAPREIVKLLTDSVIPKLSGVLDSEKGLAACSLIVNQIIGPAFRKRTLYIPLVLLLI